MITTEIWIFLAPMLAGLLWCLFMLAPAAIKEIARTIADIKTAIEELKEAWRG